MQLEPHPFAEIFPLLDESELQELAADIKRHGLREPIVLFEGKILDGRNRYAACLAAKVRPTVRVYRGRDPLDFVVSRNLRRRHLTTSQRALVAAELGRLGWGPGRPTENRPIGLFSQPERAEALKVSTRSVKRAEVVVDHGAPGLKDEVKSGRVAVAAAAAVSKIEPALQAAIVAAGPKAIKAAYRQVRAAEQEAKRERRIERERTLAARITALPDKRYGLIYADPPWQYETWGPAGMDRAADNHYPTQPTEAIKAWPIERIAAPDCVLFLWATAPMLADAIEVMAAWGMPYVTGMIWHKRYPGDGHGMGRWSWVEHEHLLIGWRGKVPAPWAGTQLRSVFKSNVLEHSEKPALFAQMLEVHFPNLPKIELNIRGEARPGWDAWGPELVSAAEAEA